MPEEMVKIKGESRKRAAVATICFPVAVFFRSFFSGWKDQDGDFISTPT